MEILIILWMMELLNYVSAKELCLSEEIKTTKYSGTCISYYGESLTYKDAAETCHMTGSYLAAITNLEQLNVISSVLNRTNVRIWSSFKISNWSDFEKIDIPLLNYHKENVTIVMTNTTDIMNAFHNNDLNSSCFEVMKNNREESSLSFKDCSEISPFICERRRKEDLIFSNIPSDLPEPVLQALDYAAIGAGSLIGAVLIMVLLIDFVKKVKRIKSVSVVQSNKYKEIEIKNNCNNV